MALLKKMLEVLKRDGGFRNSYSPKELGLSVQGNDPDRMSGACKGELWIGFSHYYVGGWAIVRAKDWGGKDPIALIWNGKKVLCDLLVREPASGPKYYYTEEGFKADLNACYRLGVNPLPTCRKRWGGEWYLLPRGYDDTKKISASEVAISCSWDVEVKGKDGLKQSVRYRQNYKLDCEVR